ncbi:ferrochelatase [Nannocystaceae bacterium ST9]
MPQGLHRTGILLVNLGTPDAPEPAPVRRYLRQFLSDPRVIDINPIGRAALLNLVILPFRPARSAAAYRKIWSAEGSPLLIHGRALTERLRERIPEHPIELGMRYGNPSIASALAKLAEQQCDRVLALPLYPQYAASSTGSTVEELARIVGTLWTTPFVSVVPPFYDHPAFLAAFTAVARETLTEFAPDHVLFSFHGLPERQVVRCADPGVCLAGPNCCDALVVGNRNCYRAQCHVTARALAGSLGLGEQGEGWSISFQSRLGRTPWIKPYTDEVVPALAKRGVGKLAVMCPAFVADCLETLEEIGMRANEDFTAAGGRELKLVPSLNSHPAWVAGVETLVREHLPTP